MIAFAKIRVQLQLININIRYLHWLRLSQLNPSSLMVSLLFLASWSEKLMCGWVCWGQVRNDYQNLRRELIEVQALQQELSTRLRAQLLHVHDKFARLRQRLVETPQR